MIETISVSFEDTTRWIQEGYDCQAASENIEEATKVAKWFEDHGHDTRINARNQYFYVWVKLKQVN